MGKEVWMILIGVIVVGIVIAFFVFSGDGDDVGNAGNDVLGGDDEPEGVVDSADFGEDVRIVNNVPKTVYQVGEDFEGKTKMDNFGEDFNMIVYLSNYRDGFEWKTAKWKTVLGSSSYILMAFNQDDSGYICCQPSFPFEGTYIYDTRVYNCDHLASEFSVEDCADVDLEDVESLIAPLAESVIAIEVIS